MLQHWGIVSVRGAVSTKHAKYSLQYLNVQYKRLQLPVLVPSFFVFMKPCLFAGFKSSSPQYLLFVPV